MATYRVLHASVYRTTGILRVDYESCEPSDLGKPLLIVEGEPTRRLQVRGGRILFDENNQIRSQRILLIEPPHFPIIELIGKRLVPDG